MSMNSFEDGLLKQKDETKPILEGFLESHPGLKAVYEKRTPRPVDIDQNGRIVSEGQSYENIPRVQALVELANAIRESLPPVQEGHIRLWRGNRQGEVGHNPSYTNSLEGIALPFLRGYGGVLSYVDVDQEEAKQYLTSGAKDSEFILPAEMVKTAHLVGFSPEEVEKIKSDAKPQEPSGGDGWTTV